MRPRTGNIRAFIVKSTAEVPGNAPAAKPYSRRDPIRGLTDWRVKSGRARRTDDGQAPMLLTRMTQSAALVFLFGWLCAAQPAVTRAAALAAHAAHQVSALKITVLVTNVAGDAHAGDGEWG